MGLRMDYAAFRANVRFNNGCERQTQSQRTSGLVAKDKVPIFKRMLQQLESHIQPATKPAVLKEIGITSTTYYRLHSEDRLTGEQGRKILTAYKKIRGTK